MRSFRASFRKNKFPYVLAFAATFLISGRILLCSSAGHAFGKPQNVTPPSQSAPRQFDPAIFEKPVPSDQLAFLNALAGQTSNDVMRDKQYRKLLHAVVPDCMYHYGSDMPLMTALDNVIDGSQLPAEIRDGRYLLISGRMGPYLAGRGMIWIDMQTGIGIGAFYFHPTNGEPTPTVNVFSRQVKEKSLVMSQLPPAFAGALSAWSAANGVPDVTTRYFISGNNEKIVLEHDEDYCAPATGATGPDQEDCEQMNADASDVDMNAALYVEQTHHATNATEWMIEDQDQVVWIQIRDDTCRNGPDPLACHIRMTRDRTGVILHRSPAPHPPPHPHI
jgi:uncharacterized protein YecT (DUF1311 family)